MKEFRVSLRRAEVDHLLTLLRDNQRDGSYYGNREQHHRRSDGLIEKLECVYEALSPK